MSSTVTPSSVPSWLKRSQSPRHISLALQTLHSREATREGARSLSRNRSGQRHDLRAVRRPAPWNRPKAQLKQDVVDHYSVAVGDLPVNQRSNRYYQLEPYDRTRVVVKAGGEARVQAGNDIHDAYDDDEEGRYINASWVRELFGAKWWIASQAPLPGTAHAFLSVILQPISRPPKSLHAISSNTLTKTSRIRTVVQLTQNIESGHLKAHPYFPSNVGQSMVLLPEEGCSASALKATLLESQIFEEAQCIQSTVSVVPITPSPSKVPSECEDGDEYGKEDEQIIFKHMLYVAWPDHGVPESKDRASLLNFLRLVDRTNKDLSISSGPDGTDLDPDPPIMVGCSAGIGRTGAFIALSSLLRAYDLLTCPPSLVAAPATSTNSADTSSTGSFTALASLFRARDSIDRSPSPSSPNILPPPPDMPPSPLGPLPEKFKDDMVIQEIDSLRDQRPGMVQRDEQAFLVYEVLSVAFSG